MDHAPSDHGTSAAASDRGVQGFDGELGLHSVADRVPHDPVGEHVLDRTEVDLAFARLDSSDRRNGVVYAVSSRAAIPSAGVSQSRALRGRPLSSSAIAARASMSWALWSVRLGRYWRRSPLTLLVRSALPGRGRLAEVDGHVGGHDESAVLTHLGALVPGQRASHRGGQAGECRHGRLRRSARLGGVPGRGGGWCVRRVSRRPSGIPHRGSDRPPSARGPPGPRPRRDARTAGSSGR